MFCTNCGISNKNIAEFCFNCGESLGGFQTEENRFLATVLNDGSFLRKVHFLRPFIDFSFNQLISQKIMKFLYGLSFLSAGLSALLFIIMGFHISMLFGIFSLCIGAPLIFLLMVIYSRVLLEMVLVISRLADRIANMGMASDGMTDIEEKPESSDGIQWNI
jgi:hypothetical protein